MVGVNVHVNYKNGIVVLEVYFPNYFSARNSCLIEHDIGYNGNSINKAFNDSMIMMADWESCQDFCKSNFAQSTYFTYITNTSDLHVVTKAYHNTCWCQNSKAGRAAANGQISGEVHCGGRLIELISLFVR